MLALTESVEKREPEIPTVAFKCLLLFSCGSPAMSLSLSLSLKSGLKLPKAWNPDIYEGDRDTPF
jgi:hypothetical protein